MDWKDVGTKYVSAKGKYTFTVKETKTIQTDKGNEGHVFTCLSADNEQIRVSLYITDSALWKYKIFASALGFNVESGTVTAESLNAIRVGSVGKSFVGTVEEKKSTKVNIATGLPEEKTYFEIVKFEKVS